MRNTDKMTMKTSGGGMSDIRVPAGWSLKRLGDVCTFEYGKALKAIDRVQSGCYPVYGSNGVVGYHNQYTVKAPFIVVGRKGSAGKVIFSRIHGYPIDTTFYISFDKDSLNSYFLYQTLNNLELEKEVITTGVPGLNRHIAYEKIILLPPYEEQKAIADILHTWDAAIEKTEALIAAKERQFGWLVTKLLNKSDHKRKHLSDFMEEISKRNRGNDIERVLSVTNHSGFVLPEDQFERRVASATVISYKIVQQGQYAYNPSRINVGSIARLDKWSDGILSPMYTVFKLNETVVDSDYFLHWLSSSEAKQRIKNSAQGSVRETVSFGDLGALPIPLPALAVQRKVAQLLNTARQEIDLLTKLVDRYRTQKRGLMQKLLTGKWRVGHSPSRHSARSEAPPRHSARGRKSEMRNPDAARNE